jgi:starvation-inducible outer membrane lipoprotein
MKKMLSLATLVATFGFLSICFAAPTSVKGYVMDAKCSTNKAMTHVSAKNTKCAQSCVAHGDSAVLVEKDGTVLKIANQDKVSDAVGHNATLTGEVADGTITVDTVKVK